MINSRSAQLWNGPVSLEGPVLYSCANRPIDGARRVPVSVPLFHSGYWISVYLQFIRCPCCCDKWTSDLWQVLSELSAGKWRLALVLVALAEVLHRGGLLAEEEQEQEAINLSKSAKRNPIQQRHSERGKRSR